MVYSTEWIELINEVEEFRSQRYYSWFRGLPDENYSLHSGIFRRRSGLSSGDITAYERNFYQFFRNLGHDHHNESEWNLLYLMQHHGTETRLLDWSESFGVALFFALKNWDGKRNAAIWMLDPVKMNKINRNLEGLVTPRNNYYDFLSGKKTFPDLSYALYPRKNSRRLIAQQGVFTLQGNSLKPLDQENDGELVKQGYLKRIVIKPELWKDATAFLKLAGINNFTLFPDLDGLSAFIKETLSGRDIDEVPEAVV